LRLPAGRLDHLAVNLAHAFEHGGDGADEVRIA
jgi:hypothetical protein